MNEKLFNTRYLCGWQRCCKESTTFGTCGTPGTGTVLSFEGLYYIIVLFYNNYGSVCSVGTYFIHSWCVLPMGVGSMLPRGGSPCSESLCWMMPIVEVLCGHVA